MDGGCFRKRRDMEKLVAWWKRDKRYMDWGKALVMALLPYFACLLYCSLRGKGIGEVYLPSSGLNDELFYYKQVEGIIQFGYPQGYFGFNESHALHLSFSAWSPVLVLPWVLWGLVFGWNLMSPIICNIVLMTLAVFLFTLFAKPDWKQMAVLALLFLLYAPFAWYMLSCMPEIICMSLLLVFYGFAAAYVRKKSRALLAAMFALSGVLTLMRPYMLLFMMLPAMFWIFRGPGERIRGGEWAPGPEQEAPAGTKESADDAVIRRSVEAPAGAKEAAGDAVIRRSVEAPSEAEERKGGRRWMRAVGSAVVIGAVLAVYALINHYLTAAYFEPLYRFDWLTAFFEKGVIGGVQNLFGSLYYSGRSFLGYMRQALIDGIAPGAVFCCYIAMLLLLLYQSGKEFGLLRRKKKAESGAGEKQAAAGGALRQGDAFAWLIVEGHMAAAFLGMLAAQLLMKNLYDGCKHLMTFLAAGLFLVSLMKTAAFKKAALMGVLIGYFFTYNETGFRDYQASFLEVSVESEVKRWEEVLSGELVLCERETPNYDNVVIWTLSDEVLGKQALTGWQYLYALPPGFGISCCTSEYVLDSFDVLKSRYLCVAPGGRIEKKCLENGYDKIVENEYAVVYRRR